ncbi:unnamed protein product, partial [Leptidea sinapis]
MRDLNYTYRKALSIYLRENGVKKINDHPKEKLNTVTENQSLGRLYKDVIISQPDNRVIQGCLWMSLMMKTKVSKSPPDITFVSSNIAVKFDWKVMNECLGSDHLCIKMRFNYSDEIKIFETRNIKCANWQKYKNYIKNQFQNLENEENPQVANVSIPMIKVPQNPTDLIPSLSHKVAQRRLALREFRRNAIPNNLNVLEKKHSEARSAIYKARAQDWLEFCDSIDEATTSSSMWCRMSSGKIPEQLRDIKVVIPLLITTRIEISTDDIASSGPLEMFNLNSLVRGIDLADIICVNLSSLKESKK